MATRDPLCPLRPGDLCRLCVPGVSGPHNCTTLAEVMRDPELRARLVELRAEHQVDLLLASRA